jgi:molybdopterin converting factor small subunit
MSVKIVIPPFLRDLSEGLSTVSVNGSTVGECLEVIVDRFPGLKEQLLDKDGELHEYITFFVNGESAYPMDLVKPVADGDEIAILNVIAGG